MFYYFLKFLHLIPFSVNLKNFHTKPSKLSVLWSTIFCTSFVFHDIYIGNFAYKLKGTNVLNKYKALDQPSHILTLFCIIWNYYKMKLAFKLIERSKMIFHRINRFSGVPWNLQCKVDKFLIRFFATQTIVSMVDYTFFILYYNNTPLILIIIYAPLIGLKYMIASSILMRYDLLLILLKSSFSQLNKIMNEKFVKVRFVKNDVKIIEDIDDLVQIYYKLFEIFEMITQLNAIPLICIVLLIFLVVETAFLMLYENLNDRTVAFRSLFNVIWVLIKVRDIYNVFKDNTEVIKKVSQ